MFAVAGFLGTRGSFMLDFVFLAMFAVVPLMGISIYLVKYRRQFQLHRRIQITLGLVLLLAVVAFEIDMRINGWKHLAEPSAYWVDGSWNDWIDYGLMIHLLFAVPTPIIWCVVIGKAMRRFSNPPEPNEYSKSHTFWAWIAAFAMTMTAITGSIFYWLAFAA